METAVAVRDNVVDVAHGAAVSVIYPVLDTMWEFCSTGCACRVKDFATVTYSLEASPRLRHIVDSITHVDGELELNCIARNKFVSAVIASKPSVELSVTREVIGGLPDGGQVAIDWLKGPPPSPRVVVVVFPGVGTNARWGWAAMVAHRVAESAEDVAVGVAVMQGHDGLPLLSTSLICTAYIGRDTGVIVKQACDRFPGVPTVLLGCSIGSGHVSHWLGVHPEEVSTTNVVGAVLVCFGVNAEATLRALDESGAAEFLLPAFQDAVRDTPTEALRSTSDSFDLDHLMSASNMEEWDQRACVLYGFKDRTEMLRVRDLKPEQLASIRVPVVFLSADNDPVTPATRLVEAQVLKNVRNAALIRTGMGSHMAWFQGPVHSLNQDWACHVVRDLVFGMGAGC